MVEDPEAQNLLTPNSLLYAPGCEWSVLEQMFELAYPAMYIGSELERYLDCIRREGSEIPEDIQKKLMERERAKFNRVLNLSSRVERRERLSWS